MDSKSKQFKKTLTDNEKREISQLWFVASHYFDLAKKEKYKLTSEDCLKKTPCELGDDCRSQSGFEGDNRCLVMIHAHLASCALRLNTIDEILGDRHNISARWSLYKCLEGPQQGQLTSKKLASKSGKIMHCFLRHGVGHAEDRVKENPAWKTMNDYHSKLPIKEIYDGIRSVINDMKNDKYVAPIIKNLPCSL